jgi:penicillin-binding protein 1A
MVEKGARQVGSTFKPILYSLAIQNGYEPCSEFLNVSKAITFEDGRVWEPRVPSWIDGKPITLKDALKKSLNNIAAQLVDEYGIDRVIEMAEKYEINTDKLQRNVSLVLGTSDMKMLEIIKPYQTIGNLGVYKQQVRILKIEDSHGKTIYEYTPSEKRVLSELHAYKMATMLRGVAEAGTASAINSKYKLLEDNNMIGGKTGTTQDSKDCWFIGFSSQLAVAVWVGPESNSVNYKNSNRWYGGNTALPVFANFFQNCYSNPKTKITKGTFKVPQELTPEMIREKFLCEPDSNEIDEFQIK